MQEKALRQKKLPRNMEFLIFLPEISSGPILKNGTELGKKAKTYMDQGLLVPDELTVDLVIDRVNQEDCKKRLYPGRLPKDHSPGRKSGCGSGQDGTESRLCY